MSVQTIKLNNGVRIPEIGLGTWKAHETGVLYETVRDAIALGYRHIDCAKVYGNQREVGRALRDANVPRKDLFVTSKIFQNKHRPELVPGALDEILEELGLEYLDLLLMHWPFAVRPEQDTVAYTAAELENVPIMDTWKAMEALVDSGKVRAIGVSNFNMAILKKMLPQCRITPAINQIEVHPYNQEHDLIAFCHLKEIIVTAYSPLGGDGETNVVNDPVIQEIAKANNCSPAQVTISWLLARGVTAIPKTTNRDRLKQNLTQVVMSLDEQQRIGQITKTARNVNPGNRIEQLQWLFGGDQFECPLI
ncbi:hypothetical protein GGF46_000072 [Coemansia sp. RSA 552]|nr:hypothetical protein GGF46_000072 [Coemansia sp. RSA 552]